MSFNRLAILILLFMPPGLADTVGLLWGVDTPRFDGVPVEDSQEKSEESEQDEAEFDEDSLALCVILDAFQSDELTRVLAENGPLLHRTSIFNPRTPRAPPTCSV